MSAPARKPRRKAEQRAESLEQILDAAEEDIFWGYHFVTGALTLSLARTGRIDHLSGGKCRSDDFDAIKERMAAFMAHGFIGVCRDRAAQRQRPPAGA